MNISFVIMVDEEQIVPNNELQTTIGEIITSYIRQTLGGKYNKTKGRKGGSGSGPRPSWTDEDKTYMMSQAKILLDQGMKPSQVWRSIGEHVNKSGGAVYQLYKTLLKKGTYGK